MGNKSKPAKRRRTPSCEVYFAGAMAHGDTEHWFPAMDLSETPTEVVIRLEVPGIDAGDLRVSIKGKVLKVEGVKRQSGFLVGSKFRVICLERGYGPFRKNVELKWVFDPSNVRAVLQNGVLSIILTKLPDRRGTVFEIPVKYIKDE